MEELSIGELSVELEKIRLRLSRAGLIHAYEDAVLIQITRYIENVSQVQFNEEETSELRRLISRHRSLSYVPTEERMHDYTEHPIQFSIYKKLGLFEQWFRCRESVGGDLCGNLAVWITNPNSDKASDLFRKIALDAGVKDADYASIDGEKAIEKYFGEKFITIVQPTFRCEEHIGRLKEIAIKIDA